MILSEVEADVSRTIAVAFPNGLDRSFPEQGKTLQFVESVARTLAGAAQRSGSGLIIALATDGTSNGTKTRGVVVHTETFGTKVLPMTITPNLVHLNDRPLYLATPNGAVELLRMMVKEIEVTIKRKIEQ